MAAKASVYRIWRDSTPTLPFPFEFNDKAEGKIKQTWADVREGMNKDATNVALAFCTGHFTPSGLQARIMDEVMRKEQKVVQRTKIRAAARVEELRSLSRTAGAPEEPSATPAHLSPPRPLTVAPMSNEERAALYNEDGGRGRLHYLKLRRKLDTKARFPIPRTSSQAYGWDADRAHVDRTSQFGSPDGAPHKKTCVVSMRASGVFPHKEFVD